LTLEPAMLENQIDLDGGNRSRGDGHPERSEGSLAKL
jgi:hypothetical protein